MKLSNLVHTGVNLNDELFVLTSQVQQVFYFRDLRQFEWQVVFRIKPPDLYKMGDELSFESNGELCLDCDEIMEECAQENEEVN